MPEDDDFEFDGDDGDDDAKPSRNEENLRRLREKAKKADEFEQRATAAERELAFAKAGIALDDPRMGYFRKGYDGDLEPDAIRAAAIEAGFLSDDSKTNPGEDEAHARIEGASVGGEPTGVVMLEDAIRNAKSEEEVMRIAQEAGLPTTWNRPT